jgi:hypothetical protein
MSKKILINLIGLSHHNVGNGLHTYESCYENLFKNLVNPLKLQGYKVDFYLQTYNTDRENDIKKVYNPIRAEFIPIQDKYKTYIQSVSTLKEMDYDFYIVTRFDLWIGVPIELNFNKFNFLFKNPDSWRKNSTTDTFYAFPKEMLEGFVKGIKDYIDNKNKEGYHGFLHLLYNDLKNYINPSRYHYIDEEKSEIAHSKKYTLSRRLKKLLSKKVLI